jgi:hypothetical protein
MVVETARLMSSDDPQKSFNPPLAGMVVETVRSCPALIKLKFDDYCKFYTLSEIVIII